MPAILLILSALVLLAVPAAAAVDPGEFSIRPVVALSPGQLGRLRTLVAGDAEAAALAAEVVREAQASLAVEPAPLQEIRYEGLLNTDPRRIADVAHLRTMDDVAAIVRLYQLEGGAVAADRLQRHIDAWAALYRPTGNDVNENKLLPLFVAYAMLRPQAAEAVRTRIDPWIADLAERHVRAVRESRHLTNRYTKHLRLAHVLGSVLGREDVRAVVIDGVRTFVSDSLRADGGSIDLERRDSLTYHCSALVPVLELAMLADPDLYDWTSPAGASLRRSVEYVVPYATGVKTRQEWLNSQVDLDRRRGAAGIDHYRPGRTFEPAQAAGLMAAAGCFDPRLRTIHAGLTGMPARRFPSWMALVAAVVLE